MSVDMVLNLSAEIEKYLAKFDLPEIRKIYQRMGDADRASVSSPDSRVVFNEQCLAAAIVEVFVEI